MLKAPQASFSHKKYRPAETTVPAFQRAQSLRFTWEALARPPSQAYFFFAAFFLAFFFAFAMLASPGYGLVRGRSIRTRNKITSKRARKYEECDRRSHREEGVGSRSRLMREVWVHGGDASFEYRVHHSRERMNFHSSGSTGVTDRRLPLRSRTMFLSCFVVCLRSSSSAIRRSRRRSSCTSTMNQRGLAGSLSAS